MDATIELDKENNFVIQLSRVNDQGLPMMLSAFAVPLNALQEMIDSAAIKKNKFIPTIFNSVDDEEDFFQTLNSRGLNSSIKVALISNLDGFWFEIGNETLKAGLVYGPIRFKTISKIIELDWPVEVYLPIYKEDDNNEEEEEPNEKEMIGQLKKMTKEEQENLMKMLEEQEKEEKFKMPKVFIVFHHDDLDGNGSAAIAYKYALESIVNGNSEDIITVPMSYGQPFDFSPIDMNNDLVIFVDFTLQPFNQMLLFDQENLIVIDHHKTTIENFAAYPDFRPEGLIGDLDNKQSAAELAWKYFFPDVSLPLFVQYISFYDTWQKDLPDWEEHILAFYEGLKVGLPSFEEDKQSWLDLIKWSISNDVNLQNVYAQFMGETLRWGKKILRHTTEVNNEIIKNNSFITEFEGYKALAINSSDEMRNFILGSPSWKVGDFDIGICFVYHGGSQNSYTCHLRTDKQQIDISEISKLHKGGGHRGAGGFQTKKLPFKFNKERK